MEEDVLTVSVKAQPFDIHFHPSANVFAAGIIDGTIEMYKYETDSTGRMWSLKAHKESCRAVRYINDGSTLLSGSRDCSIVATDTATGKVTARLKKAHGSPINRLETLTECTVASGDDDGTVKVWDTRENKCVHTFDAHEGYVSDMEFVPSHNHLISVSGEGTLTVCNLRAGKIMAQSENAEDELLSVVLVKAGSKVVCGSTDGVLLLYSYGHFEDCSDRFPGHPSSVDALLKVDESTLLTGSSDGMIRLVSILPNKLISIVGEHIDYPIERLAFSHDRQVLASASHNDTVKLWNVSYLYEEDDDEDEEEVREGKDDGREEAKQSREAEKGKAVVASEDEEDDDDSDEGQQRKGRNKKGKKKKQKRGRNNFFDDL